MNLHSTSPAIADNFVEVFALDTLKKFRANLHGNIVFIFAEAVIARYAATARVSRLNFRAELLQNILRGQSDCLRLQMTRHMIQKFLIERFQVGIELAALLQNLQKLKRVINIFSRLMKFIFAKKFVILFLEHE